MQNKSLNHQHVNSANSYNAVKEHFSIKDFNYEYDIRMLIMQVKKMRTAQKQFFASKGTPHSKSKLLTAKTEELNIEKMANALWVKYRLSSIGK